MEMNKELLKKAKEAKSAEELLALAYENGMEDFTQENAEAYFTQLHKSGELSDEELDNVAGGGCHAYGHLVVTAINTCDKWRCYRCGSEKTQNPNLIAVSDFGIRAICSKCHINATCSRCKHSVYEKGLLLCKLVN